MNAQVTEVILPSMGEGITEATVVKWLKKTGDLVVKDEPLIEVSTDKVDTEIPAPQSGTLLKTTVTAGSVVSINANIGWIGPKDAVIPEGQTQSASQHESRTKPRVGIKKTSESSTAANLTPLSSPADPRAQLARSSPLVRKMARDLNIDLSFVPGTGLGGRITKFDLEAWSQRPKSHTENSPRMDDLALLSHVNTQIKGDIETLEGVTIRREKMTKIRRIIAEHMVKSVRVSPHVTTVFEIDLQRVYEMREANKKLFFANEGFNLTYTPILIRAAVMAIKKFPIVNVSVDGDDILWKDSINIGCAVALGTEGGGGLIVPVIKNAESKSLVEICRSLNDLATRARNKKLQADEVIGGTFSVTNPGGWGSITSNPIINQPQVAMLGIGAIVKRPVVISGDQIAIRPMMLASLTFDHRVIDGEGGAMWLAEFKRLLENWDEKPTA